MGEEIKEQGRPGDTSLITGPERSLPDRGITPGTEDIHLRSWFFLKLRIFPY